MNNPFNEDSATNTSFDSIDTGIPSPAAVLTATPANATTTVNVTTTVNEKLVEERSSVITARGTAEGLVLRIDGRVEQQDLSIAVTNFLESRRSFLTGNDVALEWVGRKPEDSIVSDITSLLSSQFSVSVRSSRLKPSVSRLGDIAPAAPEMAMTATPAAAPGLSILGGGRSALEARSSSARQLPALDKNVSLFGGIEGFDGRQSTPNPMLWDEPDTRIIYGTLRSGQRVETEHSIVIFGDVNSGAEIIAGGDIVILGTLRGIAHAGAYDESGGGRVIFSLNLQPTQLRIGLVISRGSGAENSESMPRGGLPEVARVDGSMIVVEPYQSRTVWSRRRE